MGFCSSFCDSLVESSVEVSLLHRVPNDVIVRYFSRVDQSRILDPFFSETELKHFDAFDKVFVYVFLCAQHAFKRRHFLLKLRFLEQPFCFLRVLGALHVFK